jgi:ADP-ribosylglycohydrolase
MCLACSDVMTGLLVDLINTGGGRSGLIQGAAAHATEAEREFSLSLPDSWRELDRSRDRSEIRSSGYVLHTLDAALWAIASTESFEDALILAVNLADDSDTVGAVTGQLAGACYGYSAIPERWLEKLAWRDKLEAIGARLFEHAG